MTVDDIITQEEGMVKKKNPQKAFEEYWRSYINKVIRRKIEYVIEKHQPEILEFRKKWGIPEKGFRNRRSYNKWYKNQLRKFKGKPQIVFQHNAEVLFETEKFRIKIPERVFPKKSAIQSIKLGKGFFYYFRQRLLELANEINLDSMWVLPFENYIFTNKVDMRFMPYTGVEVGEKIYYSHQYKEIGRKVCLIFGPNTRLKDIKLIWRWQVKPILKKLPGFLPNPPRKKRKTR